MTINNQNHEKFIEEYLKCLVGVRAYRIVYPNASYKTARVNSCKLLKNRIIRAEVERRFEASLKVEREQKHYVIRVNIKKDGG